MKKSLGSLCTLLLLSGCQVTEPPKQNSEFDAAASIANKPIAAPNKTQQVIQKVKETQQTPVIKEQRLSTPSFNQIVEHSWHFRQGIDSKGNKLRPHQLDDLSPKALAERNQQLVTYVQQLDKIDDATLSQEDQINKLILRGQLQELVDHYVFNQHQIPLTSEYGFHVGLANIKHEYRFKSLEDYENYLAKLSQIPRYFEQQIYWMKQGLASGNTQPKAVLQGFEESIASFITPDAQLSSFYSPFNTIKLSLSSEQRLALENKALNVVENKVIASYRRFFDFMTKEYIPNARQTFGAAALPNGSKFYDNRVKYYTTLDMDAEQVHQLGLSEVARIRGEMNEIIKSLNFKGSFSDFLQFLRTDPQFYAKTPQQLLEKAAWLSKKADAILPTLFKTLPTTPYGVEAVPAEIAPKYTTGRYKGASNNNEPGYYWVNTYALDKRPLYVLPALTLHEAVPGHHLQISLNKELKNLPEFRRQSYISAFGEGWGLYAEWLGVETNYYANEYEQFGRLTYEMWRACRLVVDTGVHAKGWSRQQVLDYMSENTALSLHNIKTETDRYISWPGQALSYKIGELTIKRLRKKAQQALGDAFDVKEFHHQILSQGSIPLRILEQHIDRYIAKELAK